MGGSGLKVELRAGILGQVMQSQNQYFLENKSNKTK